MDICTYVYDLTKKFPPEEKFGLVIQMRRSAVSMPSIIAEGAGKSSSKDFVRFLEISHASSYELDTQGIISKNQEYINASISINSARILLNFKK